MTLREMKKNLYTTVGLKVPLVEQLQIRWLPSRRQEIREEPLLLLFLLLDVTTTVRLLSAADHLR
jgi:hypothetical protein